MHALVVPQRPHQLDASREARLMMAVEMEPLGVMITEPLGVLDLRVMIMMSAAASH